MQMKRLKATNNSKKINKMKTERYLSIIKNQMKEGLKIKKPSLNNKLAIIFSNTVKTFQNLRMNSHSKVTKKENKTKT